MRLSDLALASAAIKAIRDLVDAKDKEIRRAATGEYVNLYKESGVKSLDVMLDGAKVATATLSVPKPSEPQVTDAAAYLAWAEEHHPAMVFVNQPPPVKSVAPDFTKDLLSRLKSDGGEMVDPATGEVVPGLGTPPQAAPRSYSIKYALGGDEALLDAWRQGALSPLDDIPELEEARDD